MRPLTRELIRQGAWIVLAVGLASALQAWAVHVVGGHAPFAPLPFYAGVAAAAWLTSFGGGLVAVALSVVVIGTLWWRDAPLAALLTHSLPDQPGATDLCGGCESEQSDRPRQTHGRTLGVRPSSVRARPSCP